MLRLLAQREQGYEDLAALMGLSLDEVRARVKDALDQLEAEGKEAPPAPVEPTTAPPAVPPEAVKAVPEPAPPKPSPVAESKPAKRPTPPRPKLSLPSSNGARAAIGVGALAIVALVVVLLVSGGDSSDNGGETTTAAGGNAVPVARDVTAANLEAVDGSDAEGVATFGRVKNSLALQIEASGLEPTGPGDSYTVWLYESPQKMLPLASTTVGDDGKIAAQVEVPTEVLGYLASETFDQIDISLTTDATLKAALAKATKEKKAPIYTGTDVLRGTITGPIIGAASR